MNEEQVNLQAIQQYVEQHIDRVHIERVAKQLRDDLAQGGEIVRLAIALVGAELAAQP